MPGSLGRFAAVVAATAVAVAVSGCAENTLDANGVKQQAESVASLASEGAVIAEQKTRGRIKQSFVEVQAADLANLASKAQQDLEPALATPELKSTVERLQSVAEDTSVELRAIETDPGNSTRLERVAERLADLRDEASKVEERL